jgi:hypothetical protein
VIDCSTLLQDLAAEYIRAAYDRREACGEHDNAEDELFYRYIAMGLGCLEAIIKVRRSRMEPIELQC